LMLSESPRHGPGPEWRGRDYVLTAVVIIADFRSGKSAPLC
jgi:hypothetical protein